MRFLELLNKVKFDIRVLFITIVPLGDFFYFLVFPYFTRPKLPPICWQTCNFLHSQFFWCCFQYIFLIIACLFFLNMEEENSQVLVNEVWFRRSFFGGLLLLSLGSMYYHLFPNNDSLMWDRITTTIVLTSLTAWIVADRIQVSMGLICLPTLLIAGIGSVIYWHITEQHGPGDLRPYAFFTLFHFFLIFLLFILFPNKNKESRNFL